MFWLSNFFIFVILSPPLSLSLSLSLSLPLFLTGPSGSPTEVHATPINTTAINVSWSAVPVNEQNGIVTVYLLGCTSCPLIQYTTANFYYLVTGLVPNNVYAFVVAAKNSIGFGPDSLPVSAMTIVDSKFCIYCIVRRNIGCVFFLVMDCSKKHIRFWRLLIIKPLL